jgi:hypothetical protein
MRISAWTTSGRWSAWLAAVVMLGLAACSDSGSVSRQAAGVTGSSVSSDETLVLAKKKGADNANRGNGNGNNGNGNNGNGNNRGPGGGGEDNGRHRGRPAAELRGAVAGKAGACPSITFTVNGVGVRANGVTEFAGTTCAGLANGQLVKVEGQPLGNGMVLAREVSLLAGAGPAGAAPGVRVALLSDGTAVATAVTNAQGRFGLEDVTPGLYDLQATLPGSAGCPVTLSTGISLVAQQNEVEGRIVRTGTPATCGNLVLAELEAHQGNH